MILLFIIEFIVLFLILHWIAWFIYTFYTSPKCKKPGVTRKKKSFLKRLFFDFPVQAAKDRAAFDPSVFQPKGIVVFTGEQGNGKTISMIEMASRMLEDYPDAICLSNTDYTRRNIELSDWRQLCSVKNGKQGVVVILDELQNWFNSKQSKNFPPEMLSVVTQNRKNHRIILATAQNFYMLSKDIRSQCTLICQCTTLFGCLTVVRKLKPHCNNEGIVEKCSFKGMYFFIQSDKLRSSYDTYSVIESLLKSGFKKDFRGYDYER